MDRTAPTIFSATRRAAARRRALLLHQRAGEATHFLLDDMVDDVIERLGFLRHEPARALVIGDLTGRLAAQLRGMGVADVTEPAAGFDEELPYPFGGFALIASLGTLDTVNDLPGALIHIREALAPGGLMIAQFAGAGSLPKLRAALAEADGDRPAARMHPMVDVRAGGQLLQRTGWKNAVIDSRPIPVRYSSLARLVGDLRASGMGNVLASAPPPFTRAGQRRLQEAWLAQADGEGRVEETFEILTLSGWKPEARPI